MKEVINNHIKETVNLVNVTDSKYYGVKIRDEKGFISRDRYNSDKYRVYATKSLTKGSVYGWGKDSLNNVIKEILEDNDCKVFEFDTPEKLFLWFAENEVTK